MTNELFFLLHIVCSVVLTMGALKLGKEALIAAIGLQAVLANFFVVKQMMLFGLHVTCADVYIVSAVFGLNLLQEYHGKEIAKKTVIIAIFTSLWYVVMSLIHLAYQPSAGDFAHTHFSVLLSHAPRIVIASHLVSFVVQQIDCILYGRLKILFADRFIVVRNVLSITTTQFLDTVLFSVIGLYGIVDSIVDIMIMSFAVKMVVVLVASPFAALTKKIIPPVDVLKQEN